MTDEELTALVASLAVAQKETDRQLKETDKQLKVLSVAQKETELAIQKMSAEMTASKKEVDKQLKETDKQLKETDKQLKETDKQLKELGKQIGGLGKKFGSFTEGLALPSMQKILRDQFQMEIITPSVRAKKAGEEMEIDVLAYANSSVNKAFVVEVKSHLREEGILQLQQIIEKFRYFFPEHKDKKLYGILAAVDMSTALKKRILSSGFYAARIKDDTFSLDVPPDFCAKAF